MSNQVISWGKPGVSFTDQGRAEILVWAPESEKVSILLADSNEALPLKKEWYGYWHLSTDQLKAGDKYQFVLDEKEPLPDPATLYQPEGVHGPSAAFNVSSFNWTDQHWQNPKKADYIIYELHVGTFTIEGTLQAIVDKLDYLTDLGITAIEIMPFSQFAGARNWGYDGVFPYAVQDSYGGPAALQQLVDACHARGLAVILDLVYNHMGPEGNVFGQFGPYFTEKYHTPWGDAINFDDAWSDAVRHYFVENALMWFRDFHVDGLRLDAVHAIRDFSPKHLLAEIKARVDALTVDTGRDYYLIVEMDLNDTRFLKTSAQGGFGMDAQWIDEFHHALRVSSGQSKTGYYSDFEPITSLAKSYTDAYVYDGQYSDHRKRKFGVKADGFDGDRFVVFSQNHDHVGNRMLGERTSQLVSFEMQKLLAGAVLVSPYVPLLFMGEEWAETNPFLYFVSHTDPELADAVRKGRKREFAAFHLEGEAPDPVSEETFNNSKVQWELLESEPHKTMFQFYKTFISLRKSQPGLRDPDRKGIKVQADEANGTIVLQRRVADQHVLAILNFSSMERQIGLPADGGKWEKLIVSSDSAWGGRNDVADQIDTDQMTVAPESITVVANVRYS